MWLLFNHRIHLPLRQIRPLLPLSHLGTAGTSKELWRTHYMMIGVGGFILQTGHHRTLSSSSLLSLSLQDAWHTSKAWKSLTLVTMFNLKKAQVALTPNRSCWTLPLWTPSHPFLPQCTNAGTPCGGTWPWSFNCRKCQILQAQQGGMIIVPKKEGGKQSTCLRAYQEDLSMNCFFSPSLHLCSEYDLSYGEIPLQGQLSNPRKTWNHPRLAR